MIVYEDIKLQDYDSYPICELLELPDYAFKKEILRLLKEALKSVPKEYIDVKKSVNEIYGELMEDELAEQEIYSEIFCPGHLVTLHGGVKASVSTKERHCAFCGERIYKGTPILTFRPLLYDHDAKQAYVLDTRILRQDCEHYLPQTIRELERMDYYVEHWSSITDEEAFPNNCASHNLVSYGELFANGGFAIRKLNRNSKRKKQRLLLAKIRKSMYNENRKQ